MSSESSIDSEEEARNEALGLGGSNLKAILSELNRTDGVGGGGMVMGGEVLAILYDRMQNMGGDPAANALYRTLIRAAGKPYAQMLDVWMRTGKLVDPYEELCVKESKFIDKGTLEKDYTDEYWERRYTVSSPGMGSNQALVHGLCVAKRWYGVTWDISRAQSWRATSTDTWRTSTRRGVHSATSGAMETQGASFGQVSQRHP